MSARSASVSIVALGLALSGGGYLLADGYTARLAHHEGWHLIPVRDVVLTPPRARPRRCLVAVIDGLRLDAAQTMRSTAMIRARGTCFATAVGLPSLSRPSYAVLSTGVEQDRTGVRDNDTNLPASAESIWEVAREHGLRVEARSELTWWRELFPRGFDQYVVRRADENTLAAPFEAALTLAHPVYVDEAAHDHGARSAQYIAAVQRVDGELLGALAALDLDRDLVVLTADHGHRDAGGHGGDGREITDVLTCFAGRGVAHADEVLRSDTRMVAPTLSMLLGTRLPRHLRAVEDSLADTARVLDARTLGDAYVADRMVAVTRARAHNALNLRNWTEGDPTWSAFAERAQRIQLFRALGAAIFFASLLLSIARRSLLDGQVAASFVWCGALSSLYVIGYRARNGGVDLSSIGERSDFIAVTLSTAAAATAIAALAHRLSGGDLAAFARRAALLAGVALAANGVHIAAYGWSLGYPVPPPVLLFAPYLLGPLQLVAGATAALAGVWLSLRRRA